MSGKRGRAVMEGIEQEEAGIVGEKEAGIVGEEEVEEEKDFIVVVNLHGGYEVSVAYGKLIGVTESYMNASSRTVTHLAPFGSELFSRGAMDALVLDMIFKMNIDPILASQYVFTRDYISKTDTPRRYTSTVTSVPFHTVKDKTYQQYEVEWGEDSLVKIYQQDLPYGNLGHPKYGYTISEPFTSMPSIKDCIGIVFSGDGSQACNVGYFLQKEFSITFEAELFEELNSIIAIINTLLGEDLFSNTSRVEGHTVTYPIKFNMSQCKYFIAFMIKQTGGISHENITRLFTKHMQTEKGFHIPNYYSTDCTADVPFLVRTLDLTIEDYDTYCYMNIIDEDTKEITSIQKLPEESKNIASLIGLKHTSFDITRLYRSTRPKERQFHPLNKLRRTATHSIDVHADALRVDTLKYTVTTDKDKYKLAIVNFSEKNMMEFIGSVNDVVEYQFSCSSIIIPKDSPPVTVEMVHEFIGYAETSIGRGSRKSNSKSLKKYKKRKTRRKTRRKRTKKRRS